MNTNNYLAKPKFTRQVAQTWNDDNDEIYNYDILQEECIRANPELEAYDAALEKSANEDIEESLKEERPSFEEEEEDEELKEFNYSLGLSFNREQMEYFKEYIKMSDAALDAATSNVNDTTDNLEDLNEFDELELFGFNQSSKEDNFSVDEEEIELLEEVDSDDKLDDVSLFNKHHNTNFTKQEIDRIYCIADCHLINTTNAIKYSRNCHNCGNETKIGNEFCKDSCYTFFDTQTNGCFWGKDCKMCYEDGDDEDGDDEDEVYEDEVYENDEPADEEFTPLIRQASVMSEYLRNSDEEAEIHQNSTIKEVINSGFLNEETGVYHIGKFETDETGRKHFYPNMDDVRNIEYFGTSSKMKIE
jgi:hypothetical protein